MGPIRAFVRPSCAAAPEHSHAPASLFCPTQHFPSQPHAHHHHHRPYCAHVASSLPPQHHHHQLHHHHSFLQHANNSRHPLYIATAGSSPSSSSDPQGVGLVTQGPQPSLFSHFKKFLPPGAPLAGPLPVLTALTHGQGKGWMAVVESEGEEGQKDDEWGRRKKGEKEASKDKGECLPDKRNVEEIKWKKDCSQNKWKTGTACGATGSGSAIYNGTKFEPTSPKNHWRKIKDEGENKSTRREDQDVSNNNNNNKRGEDARGKRDKEAVAATLISPSAACSSSPNIKHEDPLPSTSRVAFVFTLSEDEDDDEGHGYDVGGGEGEGAVPGGENRRVTWPISDIVETEDEDGEALQIDTRDVADREEEEELGKGGVVGGKNGDPEDASAGRERKKKKPSQQSDLSDTSRVLNHLVKVVIKKPHVREPDGAVVNAKGARETEKGKKAKEANRQGKSSHPEETERPSGGVHLGKDGNAKDQQKEEEEEDDHEEHGGEEEEDEEEEGEEKQKDGVRATQRLRPRSYRQFLLTRERRSRVFLKERSYHLGRWFVTHFTHPYPSKEQKDVLAAKTKMTRNQVSEWFGNMRRRIREATRGRGICWEERVRMYNSVITGKSEPLPILPEDDINTWVAPVSQDPPALDPHEEVSASQKFKTTLLHRYLNNSEAGEFCAGEGSVESTTSSPTSNITAKFVSNSTTEGDILRSYRGGPSTSSNMAEIQSGSFLNSNFPHIFPLCTSSPNENIKKLWNNSFEHIKDNYIPPINNRAVLKEQKTKLGQGGSSEEARKLAKRSDVALYGDESIGHTPAKKARTTMSPVQEWFQRPSTSKYPSDQGVICSQFEAERSKDLLRSHIVSGPKVPLCWGIRRPVIEHSRSTGEKSSDEERLRQPEELAAAYTLMQLQHM
ncbi:uncharacterized protein [Palaemon carinicauda]|uniref:uncharacterized protein n=1 Tax=Palaemon carinicauda TaxID=392227 RepID=UPI0035B65E18